MPTTDASASSSAYGSRFDIFTHIASMREQETEQAVKEHMRIADEVFKQNPELQKHQAAFRQSLKTFCSKWAVKHALHGGYDTATDLVKEILQALNKPLVIALVEDNVDYFKSAHQQLSGWWLEAACICGSEKIAEHIAAERDASKFACENINAALAYAISTGKKSFALTMASYSLKHGDKIDPTVIAGYDSVDSGERASIADAVLEMVQKTATSCRA